MRVMSDKERKQVCYDLLKYIKKICRENGIRYSLTGGTLLGAVRHRGFIPWDDDVDVFFPRPEYEKIYEILKKNICPEYMLLSSENDRNYNFNFARMVDLRTVIRGSGVNGIDAYGVFIDLCVVDGLPNNRIQRWFFVQYMRFLYKARSSSTYADDLYVPQNRLVRYVKAIFKRYTKSKGMPYWREKIEKHMAKYPFDKSVYVGNVTSQYGWNEIIHHASFEEYIEIPFEDDSFMVIAGWEEYLSNIYGNYMELPPEDERKGHHLGTAYWRN